MAESDLLRASFEARLDSTSKNLRAVAQRNLSEGDLTPDGSRVLDTVQSPETQHAQLHQTKFERIALEFPDVSDLVWGSCVTQLQPGKMDTRIAMELISHESPGLVNGAFKGSKRLLWIRRLLQW